MLNLANLWFVWSKQSKLKQKYELEDQKIVSSIKYGQILKYKEKNILNQQRIIRIIPKQRVINIKRFKQEINQIRYLNNENITKLIELYEDEKSLYFVMESCEGGSLFEKLLLRYHLTQSEARFIFLQMVIAINTAHSNALCHRNLRPDSFFFVNKDINDLKIQLKNLGFQLIYTEDIIKKQNNNVIETSRDGKLYFTAPEVFNGLLTEKSDIWSLGVILHILLSGCLPFDGKDENEIYTNIQQMNINVKVKGNAADLICQMLTPPEKRIQLFQVQKHIWMQQNFTKEEELIEINFKEMKNLSQNNFLQKIMRSYVAQQSKNNMQETLHQIFDQLDVKGNGYVQIDQLKKQFEKKEYQEFHKIIKYVSSEDGTISYADLVNQILEKIIFVDEERIFSTFKMFDLNNSGKISKQNLWEVLSKIEQYKSITQDYCELLISEIDRDKDGQIEYLEFIEMFFKR